MSNAKAPGNGTILFVCTANICRSPYLHLRTRDELLRAGITDIDVVSAGVQAMPGTAVDEEMQKFLTARGVEPGSWQSQRLSPATILEADLILTATRDHRAAVVRTAPAALKRTFTLRQFQRLLAATQIDDPTARNGSAAVAKLVQAAASARSRTTPGADDLDDPWRRPHDEYVVAADLMESAITDLVGGIRRIRRR